MGERYKMVTKESKDLLSADDIEPELDRLRDEIKQYIQQDEDVLSYALFPQVATEFFKYRQAQQTGVDLSKADTANKTYPA